MRYLMSVGLLVATLLCAQSRAQVGGTPSKFSDEAHATREGDVILVSFRVSETDAGGLTTVRSNPRIGFPPGQRAKLVIGRSKTEKDAKAPTTMHGPDDIESGIVVDVVSPRGGDTIVTMTTIIEEGQVIWAEAKNVPIEGKLK